MGDGKSINIWDNRWIPGTEDGKVKTRRGEGIELQKVSDLIKGGMWDKEVIAQVFDREEGRKILSIPLSEEPRKDRIFWAFSNTGMYTVKSRYRLVKRKKRKDGEEWSEAGTSYRRIGAT